ncbi:hypothetical protein [Paraburkholderia sediminicola]|uniref:hypothetical protein n=1 Tax=Paraburkholderia sediminicola TaxID=458836 RepID=UPI0038BA16DC
MPIPQACETIISAKSCDHKKAPAGFILSQQKLIATTGLAPTTVRRKKPKTLRQLERDGLVSPYMYQVIPPRRLSAAPPGRQAEEFFKR